MGDTAFNATGLIDRESHDVLLRVEHRQRAKYIGK